MAVRHTLRWLGSVLAIAGAGVLLWSLSSGWFTNTGSQSTGAVQLVIDFGSNSGKSTIESTVPNFRGTGWQLLTRAGLKVQGTDEYPNSFVCRINDWPAATEQNCRDTPTYSEGSWKYFIADKKLGSGWIASGIGAAAHQTGCDKAEAWLWVGPELTALGNASAPVTATALRPSIRPKFHPCKE